MADKPLYVTEQDDRTIHQRMLGNMPQTLDKTEGSIAWDTTAPAAVELAQANVHLQEVVQTVFYPTGELLDLRLEEAGLQRLEATAATGTVTFTGTPGTTVVAGRRVSTASTANQDAIVFITEAAVTLGEDGTGTAAVTAVTPGATGNVAAGTIMFLSESVEGVASLANTAPTTGGLDRESDAAAWARFLDRRRNPSASGNVADYRRWAMEVPGVGGASPVPVRDGPGTVSVAIIGTDKLPASAALVQQVQDYIAPPWRGSVEAGAMTLSGYGANVDASRGDDSGDSVKLVYDAQGPGRAAVPMSGAYALQRPGIWQVTAPVAVDSTDGVADLLQVGMWNVTAGAWCKIGPSSEVESVATYSASDLDTAFADVAVTFYWNGQDALELRAERLAADTETTVWVNGAAYQSTFSQDNGSGRAPIGARVTVEAAEAVSVDIAAELVIQPGYNRDSVRAAVEAALGEYIKSRAFLLDNDVRYGRVGQTILDVSGVQDYSNLLVNGASTNVMVGDQQVAVLGTVTLT